MIFYLFAAYRIDPRKLEIYEAKISLLDPEKHRRQILHTKVDSVKGLVKTMTFDEFQSYGNKIAEECLKANFNDGAINCLKAILEKAKEENKQCENGKKFFSLKTIETQLETSKAEIFLIK